MITEPFNSRPELNSHTRESAQAIERRWQGLLSSGMLRTKLLNNTAIGDISEATAREKAYGRAELTLPKQKESSLNFLVCSLGCPSDMSGQSGTVLLPPPN